MLTQNIDNTSLSTTKRYFVLLDINNGVLRYVNDNQNLVWNGNTYICYPFELSAFNPGTGGEIPQTSVRLSNVGGTALTIINNLAEFESVPLKLMLVRDGESTPDISLNFKINGITYDEESINIILGANTEFGKVYPNSDYSEFCQWSFKDFRCRYAGNETSCDHSLARCKALNNSIRFGGFKRNA